MSHLLRVGIEQDKIEEEGYDLPRLAANQITNGVVRDLVQVAKVKYYGYYINTTLKGLNIVT